MWNRFKEFSKNLYDIMMKPEMLTLPSSLAYYFVLSVVPIISILLLIASQFNLSINYITEFLEKNFSAELVKTITPIITNQGLTLGFVIYILMALFIVSNGCDAIIVASNTIFNLKNKNYFVRRLKAFLLTVVLVMLFTFMLIVPVFGEQILTMLTHIGFNNKIIDVLLYL